MLLAFVQFINRSEKRNNRGKARNLLTGPNGTGKTTLFKLIMSFEEPDAGGVNLVASATIGYLAQEPETLDRARR